MRMNPYLFFKGDCESALKHYQKVLGGKITAMLPHAGTPAEEHVPKEWRSKIIHACLEADDFILMASDAPPGHQSDAKGFSVSINVDKPAEAERIFGALAEGGTVTLKLDETFFAQRFGMLVDRYGTPWMVNCAKTA
jgi:PhnB protein